MATRNVREMQLVMDARMGSGMRAATTEASKRLQGVTARIKELERQRVDVTKFRRLKDGLTAADKAAADATAEVRRLARQMQTSEKPSRQLAASFERAKAEAARLKGAARAQRQELEQLRRSLSGAGISTQNLAADSRKLDGHLGAARQEAEALTARLKGLEKQEQRTGAAGDRMGAKQSSWLGTMAKSAIGAAAVYMSFNALRDAYVGVTTAAQEEIKAHRRLETLMGRVPGTTRAGIESIKAYAGQLQKVTTIEDDVTVHGASQLATFSMRQEQIRKMIPALQDLAVGQYGVNVTSEQMQQAANLIGKAFAGQFGILSRYGILLSDEQKEILKTGSQAEKTALLIEVMSAKYGGLSRRLAETPEGKVIRLQNAIGDMREEIGNRLLPIQAKVVSYFLAHLPQIRGAFMAIANAAVALAGHVEAIGSAGVKAFGWYQEHLSGLTPIILGAAGGLMAFKTALFAVSMATRVWAVAQMLVNGAIAISPIGWLAIAVGAVVGVVYLLVKNWDKVKAAAMGAWDWMKRIAGSVAQFKPIAMYIGVMKLQWNAVVGTVKLLWSWLQRIWGIIGKIAGGIGKAVSWVGKKVGIGGHAAGGIVTRPQVSWVGEQGPEAIIPLANHRARAAQLWAAAGAQLGMTGVGSVSFNPTINISGSADRGTLDRALGQARDDFRRMLEQVLRDDRRRSMA